MGRFVLVAAAIAAAVLASCYQPTFGDCVDTCGTSGICPGGLACKAGFCRLPGATGTCSGGKVDAAAGMDGPGPGSACPMAPQGHGSPILCENAQPPMPSLPQCYVACGMPATGTSASMYTLMSWKAAAIGSAGDETAAASVAGGAETWLGLMAADGSGASPGAWGWTNGAPMTFMKWAPGQPLDQGAAGNCGALTGSGWVSEPCTKSLPFLIASPM